MFKEGIPKIIKKIIEDEKALPRKQREATKEEIEDVKEYKKFLIEADNENFSAMNKIFYGGGVLEGDGKQEIKPTVEVVEKVGVASKAEKNVQKEAIENSLVEIKNDLIWILNLKNEYANDGDLVLQKARLEALEEQFKGLNLEERLSSFDYESEKEAATLFVEMLEVKQFIDDKRGELEVKAA